MTEMTVFCEFNLLLYTNKHWATVKKAFKAYTHFIHTNAFWPPNSEISKLVVQP